LPLRRISIRSGLNPSSVSRAWASASQPVEDFLHGFRRQRPQQPLAGAGEVILDLGIEQAERGKYAGRGWDQHLRDIQRLGHAGGKDRAVAAEPDQGVFARVAAALA